MTEATGIRVVPSGTGLAASVEGLDLARPLDDGQFRAVIDAIAAHGVLRLILEMKGKLDLRGVVASPASARDSDVIDILQGLGYSAAEANAAVANIAPDAPDALDDRIRLALRYFGGV